MKDRDGGEAVDNAFKLLIFPEQRFALAHFIVAFNFPYALIPFLIEVFFRSNDSSRLEFRLVSKFHAFYSAR